MNPYRFLTDALAEAGRLLQSVSQAVNNLELRSTLQVPVDTFKLRQPIILPEDTDATVKEIREMMRADRMLCALGIGEDGMPCWICTEQDIVTGPNLFDSRFGSDRIVQYATQPVYYIRPKDPIGHAFWQMVNHPIRRVPVVDDQTGAISVLALREAVQHISGPFKSWTSHPTLANVVAADIARPIGSKEKGVICVPAERGMSAAEAAKLMKTEGGGSILITSPTGQLTGILSLVDIALMPEELEPSRTPIVEIMTKAVATLHGNSPIDEVVSTMIDNNCRHLPIVGRQDSKLLGIVSIRDVAKMLDDAELLDAFR